MQIVLGTLLLMCCTLYIEHIFDMVQLKRRMNCKSAISDPTSPTVQHYNNSAPRQVFIDIKQLEEFVGHTIDEKKGIHFTKAKTHKVFQIPISVYDSDMESFLGLAQYFSVHVRLDHHSGTSP